MQPHLKRVIFLLGVVIVGFIFIRSMVVPASYGQYGAYRADSVNELRNFTVEYAGSKSCGDENCHKTLYSIWADSRHKTVNCETCHGPSGNHVNNVRVMPSPANDSREFCGKCHFERVARPSSFPQIDPESHGENLKCAYCHNPHKPWFV
ncbi:Uncharacterised protein [uncultured archaeon]|nr:Uncharacterised protein [uncultured archaeon]